jgi:hypothetical protein
MEELKGRSLFASPKRTYGYEERINRDNVLAPEIVEDLKTGLEQFRKIAADLGSKESES